MSEENEKTEPQQHPLIHSTPDLPAPEDSLQTFMGDTPKKRMARKKAEMAVRARLESLDARTMSFNGKGTVPLTLMIDGEEVEKDLPIKTIPAYIMADISRDYQVCATSIPRRWNPDAGEWDEKSGRYKGEWEHDPSSKEFKKVAQELTDLTRNLMYEKVLYGIDIPIRDSDGTEVWSGSQPYKNKSRDPKDAINVLNKMGIQEHHLTEIAQAVDALSTNAHETEVDEFEKNV